MSSHPKRCQTTKFGRIVCGAVLFAVIDKVIGDVIDTFGLFDGDAAVVEVTQPSGWRPRLVFHFDERDFEILQKAWYSSTLLVKSGGLVVGSIRPSGLFAAGANVDLPDSLPLALRVFIGWIAMIRWDEAAAV